jgi:hypothetical protein
MAEKRQIITSLVLKFTEYIGGLKKAETATEQFGKQASASVQNLSKGFSSLGQTILGVFGGNALISGVHSLSSGLRDIFEAGKQAEETADRQRMVWRQAGFEGAELNKQIKEQDALVKDLSERFAIHGSRIRSISNDAAVLGGATGKANKDITTLALAIEQASDGAVSGEMAVRMFTKGIADPEAEASFTRLTMKFPALGAALKDVKDPAEATKIALEKLSPTIKSLEEDAQGTGGTLDRIGFAVDKAKKALGDLFMQTIGAVAIPIVKGLINALNWVLGVFKDMPAPLRIAIQAFVLLTGAVAAYTAAKNMSIFSTIKSIAVETLHNALKVAAAVKTGLLTAAQWALNAAMSANPIGAVVAVLALLVGAVIAAYNTSDGFRKVIDKLWASVREAVMFFLKWLNPIGLLVQGFTYLYEKVEFVRNAIDGVVQTVKDAGGWLLNLLGITEDVAEADEEAAKSARTKEEADRAAASAAAERAKYQQKVVDALDEEIKKKDEQVKYARAEYILAKQKYDAALKDKDVSKEQLALLKSHVTMWENVGKSANAAPAALKKYGEEFDKALDPEKKKADTLSQKIQAYISLQKNLVSLGQQSASDAKANLQRKLDGFNAEIQAELNRINKITDAKKREAALEKLNSKEIIKARADLMGAVKEYDDKEKSLRDAALLDERSGLDAQIVEIEKKYADANKAAKELLDVRLISHEDFDNAVAFHSRKTQEDIAKATKEFNDKQVKEQLDALNKTLETQAAILRQTYKLLGNDPLATDELIIRTNYNERLALYKKNLDKGLMTQEEYAVETIKLNNDTDKALAEIDNKRLERQKKINDAKAELLDDDEARELAKLQNQYDAETERLEREYQNRNILYEEYEAEKLRIAKKFEKDRNKIIEEGLKRDNIAYKISSQIVGNTMQTLTASIKSAFTRLFEWKKEASKEDTETDVALKRIETDKKIAEIDRQVRESKISYEEGLLQKRKLQEEERKSEEEQASFLTQLGQTFTDTAMGQLAQLAEAYIQQALVLLATKQAEGSGNLIAQIFASIPFPANVALAAGAFALVAGLFSGLLSSVSEQKKGIEKRKSGGYVKRGEYYTVNEEGEETFMRIKGGQHTFLAPDDGIIIPHQDAQGRANPDDDLTDKSLRIGGFSSGILRKILSLFGYTPVEETAKTSSARAEAKTDTQRNFKNIYRSNDSIIPRFPSALASGGSRADASLVAMLQKTLTEFQAKGVQVQVAGEIKAHGDELITVIRSAERATSRRAYINTQG